MVKFCDQCGTQLKDDDAFCHNCGVPCDISKRKTQNISSKANSILSDLGVDNIIEGVSNYQKNQNIRKEAIRSKKQIETQEKVNQQIQNEKPEGALFYVNGRDASLSVFEDYIQLDFTGNLLKQFLSNLGGVKKIYYYQINSIQKRDATINILGSIEFEVPGMAQSRRYGKSENVVHYHTKFQNEVDRIYDYVNQKILDINSNRGGNSQIKVETNYISQLKEAKELLDLGAITQEEFDEIKQICLEKMKNSNI